MVDPGKTIREGNIRPVDHLQGVCRRAFGIPPRPVGGEHGNLTAAAEPLDPLVCTPAFSRYLRIKVWSNYQQFQHDDANQQPTSNSSLPRKNLR